MSSYDKDIEDIQITPAGMKVLISSEKCKVQLKSIVQNENTIKNKRSHVEKDTKDKMKK